MQAAGMLRGIRAVCLLVFLISLIGYAHSFPLQLLPSIPGYIPVYIRHGDEPLEDINPALAEAFNEKISSPKSVKLENIPNLTDINLEGNEADAFIGKSKKKHIYPVHIRQAESSPAIPNKEKDISKAVEKNSDAEVLKLLPIYELHEEDEEKSIGENHHKNSRRKPAFVSKAAVVKVGPLSEAEKEDLEKVTIQVKKEESTPNDLSGPNIPQAEISSDVPYRESVQNFGPVVKVVEQIITDESTIQPTIHFIKDLSQLSAGEDTPAAPVTEEEVPIKEQRPAGVLSNVYKLSPIGDIAESADRDANAKEEIVESRQDDKMKDMTERNDDITAS